jgi:thermitase
MNNSKKAFKLLSTIGLSLMIGLSSITTLPAESQNATRALKAPTVAPPVVRERAQAYSPDILLLMHNQESQSEEIEKVLKENHCTVVGTLGEGAMKVIIVKTERGKLAETEGKLAKSTNKETRKKDFNIIQRNYGHRPAFVPNDPQFASQWHIPVIQAQHACDVTRGGPRIAVFDSGCQSAIADLNGKTDKGYNAHSGGAWAAAIAGFVDPTLGMLASAIDGAVGSGARTDNTGHGTMVATTAGATDDNSRNGAGVAPRSIIYPVKITDDSTALGDDLSIMAGLLHIMTTRSCKIANISYSGMTDPSRDPALHMYFRFFHDVYGGVIFVSAGNDGAFLGSGLMPYLNVVSAIDPSLNKADFSNWGNCVTFTAPGVGIMLTDRTGASRTANGTSFASPICAAIAALIWSRNPGLSNSQVENIMKANALRTSSGGWTRFFGFGMPDANACVRAAGG